MKKSLIIVGGFFVGMIALGIILLVITSLTSKKLICKSDEGNITLMYNDKTLTGYTAKGITYNLDEQQEIAEEIGIDVYLEQFKLWFSTNTSGSCK